MFSSCQLPTWLAHYTQRQPLVEWNYYDSTHWINPSPICHKETRRAQASIWLSCTGMIYIIWYVYRPRDRRCFNDTLGKGHSRTHGSHKLQWQVATTGHQCQQASKLLFCARNSMSGKRNKYTSKFNRTQKVCKLIYDWVTWSHWEPSRWLNSMTTYSQIQKSSWMDWTTKWNSTLPLLMLNDIILCNDAGKY